MKSRHLMIISLALIVVFGIISFTLIDKYQRHEQVKQEYDDMPCEYYLSVDWDRNSEFEDIHQQKLSDCLEEQKRFDLKEIVYSNTKAAIHWRVELMKMWEDETYDYKNDPIFIEAQVYYIEKNICIDSGLFWIDGNCTNRIEVTRGIDNLTDTDQENCICLDSRLYFIENGTSIDTCNCEWSKRK